MKKTAFMLSLVMALTACGNKNQEPAVVAPEEVEVPMSAEPADVNVKVEPVAPDAQMQEMTVAEPIEGDDGEELIIESEEPIVESVDDAQLEQPKK